MKQKLYFRIWFICILFIPALGIIACPLLLVFPLIGIFLLFKRKATAEKDVPLQKPEKDISPQEPTVVLPEKGNNQTQPDIVPEPMEEAKVLSDSFQIKISPAKAAILDNKRLSSEHPTTLKCLSLDFGKIPGELGCFLNYYRYKVYGIDGLGEKTYKIHSAVTTEIAIEMAKKAGLSGPYRVELLPHEPPTERQLACLKNNNVLIPDGLTKDDVRYIFDGNMDSEDVEFPSKELVELAIGLKVAFSAFVNKETLLSSIVCQLNDRDLAAFFAYSVNQRFVKKPLGNMLSDSKVDIFYAFSDNVINDESLLHSLKSRHASDFLSPSRGTNIYRAASAFLKSAS